MTKDSADHSKDSPAPPDLDLHVDSLIRPTLERLGIATLADIAAVDISRLTKQKGLGTKKLKLLEKLILVARNQLEQGTNPTTLLTVLDPIYPLHTRTVSQPQSWPPTGRSLPFIPSLLKRFFEEERLSTVADLLDYNVAAMKYRPWGGDRKMALLVDLQSLYRNFGSQDSVVERDQRVRNIVPGSLLPDASCGQLSVGQFLSATADYLKLKGRKKDEFHELKQFLNARTRMPAMEEDQQENAKVEPYLTMDWRDVPLVVPKRIAHILSQFETTTIQQLKELATKGLKGIGERSLRSLNTELGKLKRMGLDDYRRVTIGYLIRLKDSSLLWQEIPLRIPTRVRKFLKRFKIDTVGQLYDLTVREQVRRPFRFGLAAPGATHEWLSAVKQKNFSEGRLVALRKELQLLAALGVEDYRYGNRGKPKTAVEVVEAVSELLDNSSGIMSAELRKRDFAVFRLRCDGYTLEEITVKLGGRASSACGPGRRSRHLLSRERVRHLEMKATKTSTRFRQAAQDILKPLDERLARDTTVDIETCLALIGAKQFWQLQMTATVAGKNYNKLDSGEVSGYDDCDDED